MQLSLILVSDYHTKPSFIVTWGTKIMFRITEDSPWKLVLLQIATKFITNCGKLTYYKLQKNVITNCASWLITNCDKTIANCDRYYKLLQIVIAIRNCNSYYKLRQNRKKIWKRDSRNPLWILNISIVNVWMFWWFIVNESSLVKRSSNFQL